MTFAIIPAAGHSARMGRPKLSLPLGGRTVLEHVIAALHEGGVDHVLVVVAPHVPELVPLATDAGAEVSLLPEPTPDMRATVEHGLRWLEERYRPRPGDYWLLAPGDHPGFGPGVVRQLLASAGRDGRSIVIPVHGGRRGHPTAIAWTHVAGIRALPAKAGINTYLRTHATETGEVEVADPGVLLNLDTPEDYDKLQALTG
jgi:molybdenum cofactor cytidylyltransferase